MSADTKSKKRKSSDNVPTPAKKAKTAKSADRPAPLKSALKRTKADAVVEEKPKAKKTSTKTSKKAVVPEEQEDAVSDIEEGQEGGISLSADQTAALLAGFSSSEEDDSDAEHDEGIDLSKLPAAPTPSAVQKALAVKPSDDPEDVPGVIYISRIPHGFYEKQMRAYFTQFGTITHLRLARNKKTGKSKHFAFIEFASASVADIVVKTMDKYLLFGHILQVRRVPAEQVQEGLWKGGKAIKSGRAKPRNRIEGTKLRKGMARGAWEKRVEKEEQRRKDKAEVLKEMGYEYEMPGVKSVSAVPVKAKAIEGQEAPDIGVSVVEDGEQGGVKLLKESKNKTKSAEQQIQKELKAAAESPTPVAEKSTKRKNKSTGATSVTKKKNMNVTA